ncbi:Oidioi.mRNA.OKI2018_I69.PAR.g9699.t1.cds [Oikopleura dioica]|uniref:Oidioi.mRNA.OKI2018_I69.PAR.g9699.t1.cds n=1 Tax=Oikopleura dioica TaxID=34765 RepID=A0ABN7RMT4_OIKDI|nr:Oidioi.mRNA.OKI2018_I69.PAR.g9699.t1.cds [Oikopleura dioica]
MTPRYSLDLGHEEKPEFIRFWTGVEDLPPEKTLHRSRTTMPRRRRQSQVVLGQKLPDKPVRVPLSLRLRIPSSMEPPSSSPLRDLAIRSDRSYSCLGNYNMDASNIDEYNYNPKNRSKNCFSLFWAI